jgi:hypothetical protein
MNTQIRFEQQQIKFDRFLVATLSDINRRATAIEILFNKIFLNL